MVQNQLSINTSSNVMHTHNYVQAGCAIDEKTNIGNTAMHIALMHGNTDVVVKLVGYGANLSVKNELGDTPLHILGLARSRMKEPIEDTTVLTKVWNKSDLSYTS